MSTVNIQDVYALCEFGLEVRVEVPRAALFDADLAGVFRFGDVGSGGEFDLGQRGMLPGVVNLFLGAGERVDTDQSAVGVFEQVVGEPNCRRTLINANLDD